MEEKVFALATELGFICQRNERGERVICCIHPRESWKITRDGERWLVTVGKTPQMYLESSGVEVFLRLRYRALQRE